MGARGSLTFRGDTGQPGEERFFFAMDSFANNVMDAVGSGDALLAYATLALKVTGNDVIGSVLGSLAAAIECEKDGNIPVSPEDVRGKLQVLEKRATLV